MLELVQYIIDSGLSQRLFAFTSLDKLIIGINNPLERDREVIHIAFNSEEQRWNFEYHSIPFATAEFIRNYRADQGVEKFVNLIKLLKW